MKKSYTKYLIVFLFFGLFSPLHTQNLSISGDRGFFDYKNILLVDVLSDIRKTTNLNFIYKDELISGKYITCKFDSSEIERSISEVLYKNNILATKFDHNTLVLSKIPDVKTTKSVVEKKREDFVPYEIVSWSNPVLINRSNIHYPPTAKNKKLEGEVKVLVFITIEGKPENVKVYESSGYAVLDSSAVDFVKTKDFLPAYANGKPVSVWTYLTFKYSLKTN